MFVRKKVNKSGSVSIQIIKKVGRRNVLVKTIGSSSDSLHIEQLYQQGCQELEKLIGQLQLDLHQIEEQWFKDQFESIKRIKLLGPELLLGKIYDEIGFNRIEEELFRHLVVSRIINPGSKLSTSRYLREYRGIDYSVKQIYLYMDRLNSTQQRVVEDISYQHTIKILGGNMSVVFYDVTTIYFEIEKEDELRAIGFSKDGKHKHPQIILGLLVSHGGYPLAYHIHKGNTYEGNTLMPILQEFKARFKLSKLMVVADSGLINKSNIETLSAEGYEFIIGARIKSSKKGIKDQITAHTFTEGENLILNTPENHKLIINYSKKRAKKDLKNRQRGLFKLEKRLSTGKLSKSNINNKGYNKYLDLEGAVNISINYDKFEEDNNWDGLKGYLTNTTMEIKQVFRNYKELWKIEKAFRISKTDLKIRPIYHRLERRIRAHLCISFTAYKIYKELERQLKSKNTDISVERAIELMKTIYGVTLQHPETKSIKTKLFMSLEQQQKLLDLFEIQVG